MVLIVDDLDVNIFIFIRALKAYNEKCKAMGVNSIKEAKRLLGQATSIDLILLDHNLAGESGEVLAEFLDTYYPNIPYVYISTSLDLHLGKAKNTRNLGKLFTETFFESLTQETGINLKGI